jgi:hypothetical protein
MEPTMNIVKERERVAEMCSWCDIERNYDQKTKTFTYVARRWCNAAGETIAGHGDSAWAAVQAVTAEHARISRERGYE